VALFLEPPPRHLQSNATTLGDLVSDLDLRCPGMADRLLEPGPQIREHINVFIDGERERDLAAPLSDSSVVHVIPAVAGG
jgi:molybdopterin converting factor small subunit